MKYPEARKLFEGSGAIPHGWHYCSFHKDLERDAEPCPEAVANGEVKHLGAMKWQPTNAGSLQTLLRAASDRLHLHLFGRVLTSPEDMQLLEPELASSEPVP